MQPCGEYQVDYYGYDWLGTTIEPSVEFDLNVDTDHLGLKVTALYLDGEELLTHKTPSGKELGKEIKAAIEADWEWIETRAYQAGWTWKTRGGTDPDAQWVNGGNAI